MKLKLRKKSIFDPILIINKHEVLSVRLSKLSFLFAILGFTLILIVYLPSAWYLLTQKQGIQNNTALIGQTVEGESSDKHPEYIQKHSYKPSFDSSLPFESTLKISSIGIETEIYEASEENFEQALRKGVWRVPNFGTPESSHSPMILTAHRFGYLAWSIPYRLKNSFYNLPKLKEGGTVEIYWKQRKYTYFVYKEEEGEKITDYTADLILYTCKDLESSIRVFKYARLLEI